MTKKQAESKKVPKKTNPKPVKKSTKVRPDRIHMDQFLISYPEVTLTMKAGFTVFVGHKMWMREHEWLEAFKNYFDK